MRRLFAVAAVALVTAAGCSGSGPSVRNDLVASAASFDLAAGPAARFMVGLQTTKQRLVSYGTVQLRFTYLGPADESGATTTRPKTSTTVRGPTTTARFLSVPGSPPANSRTGPAALIPSQGRGVYEAQVAFDKAGYWQVEVRTPLEGESSGDIHRGTSAFQVWQRHLVPAPGDLAIPSENLTVRSPNQPPSALDSRAADGAPLPDPELHQTTIKDALAARRATVVVFSTPVYCVSRFCGPVTDLVQEVARSAPNRADFIHIEIWHDFQKNELNKTAAEWLYRKDDLNEPWVFVIAPDGRITARFDNVVDRAELEAALNALPPASA